MRTAISLQKGPGRLRKYLKEKFFLRFHMSLIMTGSFLVGMLVSTLLLHLGITEMVIRYPVAVLFSYLAFFGCVKLWLLYMTASAPAKSLVEGIPDLPDIGDGLISSTDFFSPADELPSGGGNFGGGGASGFFETTGTGAPQPEVASFLPKAEVPGGNAVADVADAADAASSIFDDAGVVLIILGILFLIIFGLGGYLIYQAPLILSDAAFNFLLAASLARRAKKIDSPDWVGGIFKATVWPFLVVLIVSVAIAYVAQSAVPHATRLVDVVRHLIAQL